MRPEPTTAQGRGSIVLRTTVGPTIGQAYGCSGEHITVGPSSGGPIGRWLLEVSIGQAYGCTGEHITVAPSLGGPIGRRLLGVSTGRAFGCPDHALGPSIDRKSDVLAQEIARGSGGASRRETLWDRAGLGHSAGRGPSPWPAVPRRSVMSKGSVWLAAMAFGILAWDLSVSALAQPEGSERVTCPEGYTLVGSECINADGDVVEPQ